MIRLRSLLSVILSVQIAVLPGCGSYSGNEESTSELQWDADTPDSDRGSPGNGDILRGGNRGGEVPEEKDPPAQSGYCLTNCSEPGEKDEKTGFEFAKVKDSESGEYAGVVAVDSGSENSDGDNKTGTVFTTPEYGAELLEGMGADPQSVADALAGKTVVTGGVTCKKSDGSWELNPSTVNTEKVNQPDPSRAPGIPGSGIENDNSSPGQTNITPDTAGTIGQTANHKSGSEQPAVTSNTPASSRSDGNGESLFPDTGNKPLPGDLRPDDQRPKGMPGNGNVPQKDDPVDVATDKIRENANHQAQHLIKEFGDANAGLNAGKGAIAAAEQKIRQTHNNAVGQVPNAAGLSAGMNGAPVDDLPQADPIAQNPLRTTPESPHYNDLQAAYDYLGYVGDEVAKDNGPDRKERQNAVDTAGVGLDMADAAFADGDTDAGENFLKNSLEMLDMALDFVPGVSLAKDVTSLITGTNPVTGQKLSGVEMAVTASMLFLPSAVSGTGKTSAKIGARLAKAANKNPKAAELAKKTDFDGLDDALDAGKKLGLKTAEELTSFAKFFNAFKGLPEKLQPKRIRAGTNDRIAIIGRSMGNPGNGTVGVKDVAAHLKQNGLQGKVDIFDGPEVIGQDALKQWEKLTANGAWLTDDQIQDTLLFKRNVQWIKKMKEDGANIIDIGNPNNLPDNSIFYRTEIEVVFKDH